MSRDYSGLSQYFCWLCQEQASPLVPVEKHYESGAVVRFCSYLHRHAYLQLAYL